MPLATNDARAVESVSLSLVVEDRDTVAELLKFDDETERDQFALTALRIGVLALRQASGVVDAKSVQQECDRFLHLVNDALTQHSQTVSTGLGGLLKQFFDPDSGEFQRRIDRLIRKDGELETLLANHLNGDGSALSRTLQLHIGEQSPLFQMLSPDQKKGLLAALTTSVQEVVAQQSQVICGQFSLDDKQSALSRLVTEITQKNGDLRQTLTGDLETVRKEFSLDNKDGALARLVNRVEAANNAIVREFSADNDQSALRKLSTLLESTSKNIDSRLTLDDEKSPLSRLRGELLKVISDMGEANTRFQADVRTTLETLSARKQEAARSTTHGLDFEVAVGKFLSEDAAGQEDLYEATGSFPGAIHNSKVGDFVLTLSPNSAAPGAKIVVEAKEKAGYTLKKAREEIATARENRDATMGVFIYSRGCAPADLKPLTRYGNDVFVVWDPEDALSDVYLKAALSVARALVVQRQKAANQQSVRIHEMEDAVNTITSEIAAVDDILKSANLAKQHSEKITKAAEQMRSRITDQVDVLRLHVAGLQKAAPSAES